MFDFKKTLKKYLLGESLQAPDVFSYITVLSEILSNLKGYGLREKRNLEIARQHMNEIRKYARKMTEQIQLLEEQIKILEENKEKKNKK